MTEPASISRRAWAIRLVLLVSAYFVTGWLGLLLPFVGTSITLIWLPTGIAVAALLRWGNLCWPAILVGALVTNLAVGSPPLLAASIALGNTLGPLLAAHLLRKWAFHSEFSYARDIFLLAMAAAIGMTLSAAGGVASLVLFGELSPAAVLTVWLSWWAGDFVGVLLAAPLLLNFSRALLEVLWKRRIEFGLWILVTLALSVGVFFFNKGINDYPFHLVFTVSPIVVWSALRFGIPGSALGALLPTLIAAWATHLGQGPFAGDGMVLLWLFASTLGLTGLVVVALQSGRWRTEEALRGKEASLRAILDNSPYLAWLKDVEGRYVMVNKGYADYYRLQDAAEVIGKTDFDLHSRELAEKYRANDAEVMATRRQMCFEDPSLKDGQMHWTETFKSPVIDESGKLLGTTGFAHDISERRQAERELRRSRDLLDKAQRMGRLGSWELNHVDGELNWSAEVFRIFELDPALFSPSYEKFLAVIHPGDRDRVSQAYAQSLIDRQPYDITHRLLFADGRIKWVREHCTSEFDASGRPLISVGAVQDITEQHLAAEQLRIAAATFESQEAICVTDPQARILRVNRAFVTLSGYSAEEMLGQNPRILQSGRHDADFYRVMWSELLGTGKWAGEIWDRRKNGEVYPKWMTITAVYDEQQRVTHYVAVSSDITRRKQVEQEVHQLAFYDALTELPNRRLLLDRLQQALVGSQRSGGFGALMFMDMDNFKTINDTRGHDMGDLLLLEVAQRLQNCVRGSDTVARLGGDEFVVILHELGDVPLQAATQAEVVAEKIVAGLNQPYRLRDLEHHSSVSVGVCLFHGHDASPEELLKRADTAMYQAKQGGRNTVRFFESAMQQAVEARAMLENRLRRALERNELQLYYQSQIGEDGRIGGAEVLLRWFNAEQGRISPAEFIPVAEDSGLILPIGRWVLESACEQLQIWSQDAAMRHLVLAVNVSARQFHQADFVEQVQATIRRYGIRPRQLKLELTESMVLADVDETIAKMEALRELGVGFSMDDFGTGYSSLSYLKRLPLDQIKIDQSFVRDLATDRNDEVIVRTIIDMARNFGLNVIAEGVETSQQIDILRHNGCFSYQGYYFNEPLPLAAFRELFHAGRTSS